MYFIDKIIENDLNNSNEESIDAEVKCTELIQVKEAIDRINGTNKTAVVLKKDDSNFMIIGGGQNGKYIVNAYIKGKMYSMANKFNVPKDSIELIVGGKAGIHQSKYCLNLEMVLESAKHFALRGALAQTFNWETK
ncbi:MAG: hypothetical protein NTY48_04995 [Candidatus Diapherotrites archaeon]|nr:hypothetical protein [Candidatus Diapherotrites archaeon]